MYSSLTTNCVEKSFSIICLVWLFASCTPARYVKPLDKGQKVVTASLGGPLLLYANTTIPAPLTSIAAGYGFSNDLTGFAGIHTTSLLFGVFQTDIGIVKQISKQHSFVPGISISPVANLMIDKWEGKFSFFPQADLNFYWNYLKKPHYAYIGLTNWFDIKTASTEDPKTTRWLPVIQLGNTMFTHNWAYTIELKFAPKINNPVVADYQGIGKASALGVYFGVTRKLFNAKTKNDNH